MSTNRISKQANLGIGIDNFSSGIWRLSHIHYTGHYLPKRRTAYPALTLIVLLVGVFLLTWSKIVSASNSSNGSFNIAASVIAPAIKTPATINYPLDNSIFYHSNLRVSGQCYYPSYVDLLKNGIFAGTALCSQRGDWFLNMTLLPGENQLQASIFNLTNLAGPVSKMVTVNFNSKSTNPLILKSGLGFIGVTYNQATTLNLDIEGGQAPYAVNVSWGDGSSNLISRSNVGIFSYQHTYLKPKNIQDSYSILVTTTDYYGNQSMLQLLAIVNENLPFSLASNMSSSTPSGLNIINQVSKYIWPSYAVVILMLISFWLGERQDYYNVKSHHK